MSTTTRPVHVFKRAAWENLLTGVLFRLGRLVGATYDGYRREWRRHAKVGPEGRCFKLGLHFNEEPSFYIQGSWHLRINVGYGSRSWNGAGYIGCRTIFVCRNANVATACAYDGWNNGKPAIAAWGSRVPWQIGITNNAHVVPCPSGY